MTDWKSFNRKTKLNFKQRDLANFKKVYNPYIFDRIHFKTYPRMKKIRMTEPVLKTRTLEYCLKKRYSARNFSKQKISFRDFSALLHFGAGIGYVKNKNFDRSRRYYPSAGARYPLELYTAVFGVRGLKKGIYHYNLKENALELLLRGNFKRKVNEAIMQPWVKNCSAIFLVSAVFGRTVLKYGKRGYRYVMLDCGHMAQNIYLVATAMDIGCCTIGGFWDDKLNDLLDIDGETESVIYVIAIGKMKA